MEAGFEPTTYPYRTCSCRCPWPFLLFPQMVSGDPEHSSLGCPLHEPISFEKAGLEL